MWKNQDRSGAFDSAGLSGLGAAAGSDAAAAVDEAEDEGFEPPIWAELPPMAGEPGSADPGVVLPGAIASALTGLHIPSNWSVAYLNPGRSSLKGSANTPDDIDIRTWLSEDWSD